MTKSERSLTMARRTALGLIAGGLVPLGGCAKTAVKSADEAASGADDAASKGPSGLSAGDDVISELAETTTATDNNGRADASTSETTTSDTLNDDDLSDLEDFSAPLLAVDTDLEINEGSYRYWKLFFTEQVNQDVPGVSFSYSAIVREGPRVDLYLLPREEFEYFKDGQSFKYYSEASRMSTYSADVSGKLRVRDYLFLIDNSRFGATHGEGTATVSVEVTCEDL